MPRPAFHLRPACNTLQPARQTRGLPPRGEPSHSVHTSSSSGPSVTFSVVVYVGLLNLALPAAHRAPSSFSPTDAEAQETLIQCGETKGVRSRDGDQGAQTYLTRQAGVKTRSAPAPASQEDGGPSGERGREQGGGGGGRTCLRTGSVCRWEFRGFFSSGKTASRSSWRPGERAREGTEEG